MDPAHTPPSQDHTLAGDALELEDPTRLEFADAGQAHTSLAGRRASERPLARGDEVGRYVILERVGAGGMGVVYAAWDPKLDRKVALKLLHSNRKDHSQRLEREAQALARLTHPNVISVHDVGELAALDDRVFVAMEFIEGQTLRAWAGLERSSAQRPSEPAPERAWSDILEVLLAAGRGLAAAHDHGLIHRDFKPDNVMIGDDGRVCVMDFGLARAARGEAGAKAGEPSQADEPASAPRSSALEQLAHMHTSLDGGSLLESELTMAGSLLGTPAYMAPEQLRGDETDARADQFSYCVTLWQCLYGARPFSGDTPLALLFAISNTKLVEPPSQARGVPARIRRALERGLAARPEQRWPDMHALLRALADDPVSRRRPWVLGLASLALAAAAASAAILLQPAPVPPPPPPCEGAGAHMHELWSDTRAAELAQVFSRSELIYADETWARAATQLDAWSRAWISARVDACEATELRHEQSSELLDLRMACLDQRLLRFGALLELLDSADDGLIENTIEAVEALPTLEVCGDQSWLTAASRPPDEPTLAAGVERLREDLARVEAMVDAGKSHDALPLAEALDAKARELDWQPARAEAALALGRVHQERAEFTEARAALEAAFFAARRGSQDEVSVSAATLLVYNFAIGLGDLDAARGWSEHALAEAERVGRKDLLAEVYAAVGIQHYVAAEIPAAAAAFARSLELHDVEESSSLAEAHINYGTILNSLGREHEQQALAEVALGLEMLEHKVGPQHPALALALSNYATVHSALDHFAKAIALLQRALEINERALGPQHPTTALVEMNLAMNLVYLHKFGEPNQAGAQAQLERAQLLAERSLATHLQVFGPRTTMVARSERALAQALQQQGRPAEALPHFDVAIEILVANFGADGPDVALTRRLRASCDAARASG